jgi:type I site-specific restriction endonuclease
MDFIQYLYPFLNGGVSHSLESSTCPAVDMKLADVMSKIEFLCHNAIDGKFAYINFYTISREIIDQKLTTAGWIVQDFKALNLGAGLGVAVHEFQTASGPADYVLFVDRKAVGEVEAKPEGTTLRGVFEQSARYMANFPEQIPHVELPLPFSYESTGTETLFVDLRDPDYRSRRVFSFHRPETLARNSTSASACRRLYGYYYLQIANRPSYH